MRCQLIAHLLLQSNARVKHHAQQANDAQVVVEVGLHLLDGVDQIGQPFQSKVFALHGHDHTIGAAKAVECQHGQRRRTVDQYEVVVGVDLGQRVFQPPLTALQFDQLNFRTGELPIGAQNVVPTPRCNQLVAAHSGLGNGGRLQQYVINTQRQTALVHAGPHRGIALGIKIHHQDALAQLGQTGGQIHRGGGFANATLLVGNTKDFGHERTGRRGK